MDDIYTVLVKRLDPYTMITFIKCCKKFYKLCDKNLLKLLRNRRFYALEACRLGDVWLYRGLIQGKMYTNDMRSVAAYKNHKDILDVMETQLHAYNSGITNRGTIIHLTNFTGNLHAGFTMPEPLAIKMGFTEFISSNRQAFNYDLLQAAIFGRWKMYWHLVVCKLDTGSYEINLDCVVGHHNYEYHKSLEYVDKISVSQLNMHKLHVRSAIKHGRVKFAKKMIKHLGITLADCFTRQYGEMYNTHMQDTVIYVLGALCGGDSDMAKDIASGLNGAIKPVYGINIIQILNCDFHYPNLSIIWVVKELINIELFDALYDNDVIIIEAAKKGNIELFDLAVTCGCNPRVSNQSAMLWAIREGRINMINHLLTKYNITFKDKVRDIYHLPLKKEMIEWLKSQGVNVQVKKYDEELDYMLEKHERELVEFGIIDRRTLEIDYIR